MELGACGFRFEFGAEGNCATNRVLGPRTYYSLNGLGYSKAARKQRSRLRDSRRHLHPNSAASAVNPSRAKHDDLPLADRMTNRRLQALYIWAFSNLLVLFMAQPPFSSLPRLSKKQ